MTKLGNIYLQIYEDIMKKEKRHYWDHHVMKTLDCLILAEKQADWKKIQLLFPV